MCGGDIFLEIILGFRYYIMFFQEGQKPTINRTFKNFHKASQNRDWAIVIKTSFISFCVNENDFGASTIFRKNVIPNVNLKEPCRWGARLAAAMQRK